jgi:hypothetical protein
MAGERLQTMSWSTFWGLRCTLKTGVSATPAAWGGRKACTQSHVFASHTRTVPSLDAVITCRTRHIFNHVFRNSPKMVTSKSLHALAPPPPPHTHTCTYARTRTRVHAHTHAHTRAHTHTHTHTHTHKHTHTHRDLGPCACRHACTQREGEGGERAVVNWRALQHKETGGAE